jgi:hypothetical protein
MNNTGPEETAQNRNHGPTRHMKNTGLTNSVNKQEHQNTTGIKRNQENTK